MYWGPGSKLANLPTKRTGLRPPLIARYVSPDVSEAELTKVRVDLPNHWATGGESFWARPLGNDRYELHNVPFHAYDLNFLDVVEAVAATTDLKPEIRRVVRRSGHRTLRVIFPASTPEEDRVPLLESLGDLQASFEGANETLFALDIKPSGNYQAVRDRLDVWEKEGLLDYETCEARVEGSFDDEPHHAEKGDDAG